MSGYDCTNASKTKHSHTAPLHIASSRRAGGFSFQLGLFSDPDPNLCRKHTIGTCRPGVHTPWGRLGLDASKQVLICPTNGSSVLKKPYLQNSKQNDGAGKKSGPTLILAVLYENCKAFLANL
jgi:hypothetical protein